MLRPGDRVIDTDFEVHIQMVIIKSTESQILVREGRDLVIRYKPKEFKFLKLISRPVPFYEET